MRLPNLILIDIEGTDASGKETQSVMLRKALEAAGMDTVDVHFPTYGDRSAALVEDYLAGRFGTDPAQVNPYAASSFYAADRFAVFNDVDRALTVTAPEKPRVIVLDRYVASNAIHQCAKLPDVKRESMYEWLMDLEHVRFGLPEPDAIVFLDADPDVVRKALDGRTGKDGVRHDIHETNQAYLRRSRETGLWMAEKHGWTVIPVTDKNGFRDRDEIHADVRAVAAEAIRLRGVSSALG